MLTLNRPGGTLLVRDPGPDFLKAIRKLKTSAYYDKLLGLVVNRRLSVNAFTGDIGALRDIINDLEELLWQKNLTRKKLR
jgi:hypothetical protein